MTRLINIPEQDDFFQVLRHSLKEYAIESGMLRTGYTYHHFFADKLGIKSQTKNTQFSNLVTPNTGKHLKTIEFIYLLDRIPEHQKPTLDYLCDRYGYICSEMAHPNPKEETLKDMLLNISSHDGFLISEHMEAIKDEEWTKEEIENQIKISYDLRSKLIEYEESLKALKNDL